MADEYTPDQREMLERQLAYFGSDDHIRREIEPWRDTTPEQRLAELADLCRGGQFFLHGLDPDAFERLVRADRLPPDSEAIFLALRSAPR